MAGGLTFNGGTLDLADIFASARTVTLNAAGGTIQTAAGASATLSGVISGPGALTKIGAGELVLGGTGNSYSGGTFVNGGTLTVASGTLLGDPAGRVTLDGGTLNVPDGFATQRPMTLNEGGGTLLTSGPSATFGGVISGPGRLTVPGPGTIILFADNDYTGGTTIGEGTLQVGADDVRGSIVGDVLNGGSLIFSRKDPYTFAGNISGTGSVTFEGGGFATVAGTNTHTGETRIIGVGGVGLTSPGRQLGHCHRQQQSGQPVGTHRPERSRQARAGRFLRDYPFDPSRRHLVGHDRYAGKYGHRFGRPVGHRAALQGRPRHFDPDQCQQPDR